MTDVWIDGWEDDGKKHISDCIDWETGWEGICNGLTGVMPSENMCHIGVFDKKGDGREQVGHEPWKGNMVIGEHNYESGEDGTRQFVTSSKDTSTSDPGNIIIRYSINYKKCPGSNESGPIGLTRLHVGHVVLAEINEPLLNHDMYITE